MNGDMFITVPEQMLEAIARRAAELIASQTTPTQPSSPYLTTAQAADYLCCSRQRIHDLLTAGRLSRFKEGRRTLVLRTELDDLIELDRRRRN